MSVMCGGAELIESTVERLLELGTALSIALFQEIHVELFGGEGVATAIRTRSLVHYEGLGSFGNYRHSRLGNQDS